MTESKASFQFYNKTNHYFISVEWEMSPYYWNNVG